MPIAVGEVEVALAWLLIPRRRYLVQRTAFDSTGLAAFVPAKCVILGPTIPGPLGAGTCSR
ncbi:MAG: hypothetical protein ACYCXN_09610, partial [Acidimicrobiales bacterium]